MEAVVVLDYEKQQDDELNIKVGEIITQVTQVEDGWCEGTNKNGERGMFPDNFVQMRPASKQQTQQPEETTPLSTPLSTPKPATPTVVTRESVTQETPPPDSTHQLVTQETLPNQLVTQETPPPDSTHQLVTREAQPFDLDHNGLTLDQQKQRYQLSQELGLEQALRHTGLLISDLQKTDHELGRGNFGVVKEVLFTDRKYAAKRSNERECRYALYLSHPNIIRMIGVHLAHYSRTLVMELMDTDLEKYLKNNSKSSVPLSTKYSILRDVASGLVYLHSLPPPLGPLVHADIAPRNILLSLERRVVAKIADFGLADIEGEYFNMYLEQVKYMPPEVVIGTITVSGVRKPSKDIFSFGVLALETLTHEPPISWEGSSQTEVEKRKHLLDMISDSPLRPLVIQCLSNEPSDRPTANNLFHILEQNLLDVDEQSRIFLEEAMKQGYVEVTLVKVLVEGPAGVSKTSVIYLLLGKPPPEDRHSTGCAERAIRVIRIGKEGEEWNEISAKEFQEMIAEAVPILCEQLKAKGKGMEELNRVLSSLEVGERKDEGEGEGERGEEGAEEVGGGGEEVKAKENVKGEEVRKKKKAERIEKKVATDGKAVIDGVIQKLTQLVGGGKSSRRLLDMELIYLTDTGGQQPFWDLVPIFARDTSATLFVNRLCEKLDEHPRNDLYQRGKQVGPSQRASLTTEQAFKTMLRGLHEGEGKRSKIIAVGTHRDLAGDCEETLEEKNKKFAAIASPYFEKDVVFRNDGLQEIVFPVNAQAPEEDDEKEASKIRASIEEGATQHKIPIWWFILQMILEALAHKLDRDVLSKDDCLHISDSLGFAEGELDAALAFFDKLNIFLYKKSILPNVVFTNPQVPIDKLSRLVEKQYHLKAAEADPTKATGGAMGGQWKNFRDSGILTLQCLNEFKAHYVKGIFVASDFIHLLKELLIISPLSPTEYFFPAVLSMTPESRVNGFLESCRATETAPLVVKFPTGWAPPGVYCCSVCHLQSKTGWEVAHKPPTSPDSRGKDTPNTQLCKTSRNSITFSKHGRPGTVTFIDNFSFFIACVNVDTKKMDREEIAKHCQAVRSELFAAVEAGLENTHHKNSRPVPAFLCPHQNKSCSTELHSAHLSDNGQKWICSVNSSVFDSLSPDQTLWLGRAAAATLSKTSAPKMKDLANRVAAKIPHKWKQVAIQLELSRGEIKAVEKDENTSFDRFMAILDEWKQSAAVPYTWKTIVSVLKSASVDEVRLANELEKDFC